MTKMKNPSNRNSLPSIIISKFDNERIYELKVKYEKLARLDKVEIISMHLDEENRIVFDKVSFNGSELNITDPLKLEFDSYTLCGKKQINENNKTIVTLLKDGKPVKYNVFKKDGMYFKNGKEFIIPENTKQLPDRVVNDKFVITIQDKVRDENKKRKKETQRDILKDDTIKTYKRISSYTDIKSEDIYTIKRYITFKSDMMFFYTFIDEFFNPIKKNNEELWKIDFSKKNNLKEFIEFSLNDTFKNQERTLENYTNDLKTLQSDFTKINNIFSKIRHSLAHFNFKFIDELLSNKKIESFDFDIKLLNEITENISNLYFEAKKEFIEDESINILDEKELSIKKLYTLYSKIDVKKPAFNKLINSFIIKDGIENQELKEYILSAKNESYFIDIHANKEYKSIYNEHKKLVSQNQLLQLHANDNGKQIKELNDKLEKLKAQMNSITKQNSLKRLEYKLRIAFGFIATQYANFKEFNNNFDEDIKKGRFKEISFEKIKSYLETSYTQQRFFNYGFDKKRKKPKSIFDDIQGETLKELVQDDDLLKVILLFYIFTPKELKGEFLGFIKKFYHDTKNISKDTKEQEPELEEVKLETPLKLKILEKNLKKLTIFNYSISSNTIFDGKNHRFYQKGNRFGKIYSKFGISHNPEEFDKSLLAPLLNYYMNLYKLIGDFEIYLLLKFDATQNLTNLIDNKRLEHGGRYNFTTLLFKAIGVQPRRKEDYPKDKRSERDKKYDVMKKLRDYLSHKPADSIIQYFKNSEKKEDKDEKKHIITILAQRETIINLMEEHSNMKKILKFDAINDFTMKTIQLLKSLDVQSDKSEKIKEMLSKKELVANDFYNIYKLKGVEAIKKELFNRVGKREIERKIEEKIAKGGVL